MASVPSAGCLLARNQYYRTRLNSESSVSSSSSCCLDAVNITDQDKALHGLPELIDKHWWIKSFFHSEPSPPTVGRKTLSASSTNS
ncbi:pancreatic progenitor cell differentiation and proliferation factor-like protein isoform X2 [Passer montanus]|uniref:pancreatic progenitor cell differentiation and proliferation factor-like protein isoform X2 n=1 Tax=Passer montanus TaxID=9160 RepID=UPI0019615E2F|nr:pancreatic progenitor cell differentiation and proliferation factor-like protein isoform X2 [Passer montanus]XP_039558785.1 pancreatic progenitor cell differentiation and proliferation factor-like protein isoform X2 [Passer montanus]XP_039558786.1 pancreatic progenitor cell differentiation and proliferation factor-like protein isoform X2 [Passer montanus]